MISAPAISPKDAPEQSMPRHVELILRHVESLPTLPAVATRLLALTSSDDSQAREVVELVQSDPTLTAKILGLCRHADLGVREEVLTVERAVVLLGFNALRNAVLSIKVIDLFRDRPSGPGQFDPVEFWRHSLAVGVLAELIAKAHPNLRDLDKGQAFVCGLLHDVGKLAMDQLLPQAFARVTQLAAINQGDIAEFERRVVGLDHHTLGRRLAQQWRLPQLIQDCVWLHGSPLEALPRLPHRRLVGLVALADLVARRNHVGYSGNFLLGADPALLAAKLGFNPLRVEQAVLELHEELRRRSAALGLDEAESPDARQTYLASIQRANQTLGRLNSALERRGRLASRQSAVLRGINAFLESSRHAQAASDVLDAVALSAAQALQAGPTAVLYPMPAEADGARCWLVAHYDEQGQPRDSRLAEEPTFAADLSRLQPDAGGLATVHGLDGWLSGTLEDESWRRCAFLAIPAASDAPGVAALLAIQHAPALAPEFNTLREVWAASLHATERLGSQSRLGEELAQASRSLAQAQEKLVRAQSLAQLGEIAAGAAHEMNNPLAVISGRAQLLSLTLSPGSDEHKASQAILEQAHRLSDLITSLRLFAQPVRLNRRRVDLHALLDETLKRLKRDLPPKQASTQFTLTFKSALPAMELDAEKIGQALSELLANAAQSGASHVTVTARTLGAEPSPDNQLLVQISDDGAGMDAHTLAHAMDPFFSQRPAGRRLGMGLPRAQQFIAAHGGGIDLRSAPGQGTTVTVSLPLDPPPEAADTSEGQAGAGL